MFIKKFMLLILIGLFSSIKGITIDWEEFMQPNTDELPIVVVIPSYNNYNWCVRNMASVLSQNYSNFRVIFVDDCSTDGTYENTKKYVEAHDSSHLVSLLRNEVRCGAMANLYKAIHACPDDAIIVTVDGDDWLAGNDVLAYINEIYKKHKIWLTYGNFASHPSSKVDARYNAPFTKETIANNAFRSTCLPMSHLRTFKAWLFKSIKLKDFFYKGKFLSMTWDKAMLAPMIEMAGEKHRCLSKVLYIYNESNPINDHKIDVELQHSLARMILSKKPYERLNDKKTVSLSENKSTDLVIFSSQCKKIKNMLDNLQAKLFNIDQIWLVYDGDQDQYQELLGEYQQIKGIDASGNYRQKCRDLVDEIKSDYVIFATDTSKIPVIDLNKAVYHLERTHAFAFVLSPHDNEFVEQNHLWENVYALQRNAISIPLNLPYKTCLYRSSDIRSFVARLNGYENLENLFNLMNRWLKGEQIILGVKEK